MTSTDPVAPDDSGPTGADSPAAARHVQVSTNSDAERNAAAAAPPGPWMPDHRGSRCRVNHGRGEEFDEDDDSESSRVDWGFTIPLVGCLGFLSVGACALTALAITAITTLSHQAPIVGPIAIAALVGGAYIVYMLRRRRRTLRAMEAHRLSIVWLARGQCPGCGYSLVGLIAEADGCRVCPECGGAWRLNAPSA
jgi:hypothetical protein